MFTSALIGAAVSGRYYRSDDPRKFAPQLRCDVQLNVGHIEGYS